MQTIFNIRVVIAITILFGLGPWWLTSREMWDGLIGTYALQTQDWEALKSWQLDSNWYITYGIFISLVKVEEFLNIPIWFSLKFWLTLMVLGIAKEVYHLVVNYFSVPKDLAVWCIPLVLTFPIWYIFFSYSSMLGHLTCVWLALIGYRYINTHQMQRRVLGGIFLLLSFQLASNCVFILALEGVRLWMRINCKNKSHLWIQSGFIVIGAVVVFLFTRVIWPPSGLYAGYNSLINPFILINWKIYFKYTLIFATWLLLLFPSVLLLFIGNFLKNDGRLLINSYRKYLKQYCSFFILMLAASVAYIIVGVGSPLFVYKTTQLTSLSSALANINLTTWFGVWYGGWGARHVLLLMVPICMANIYIIYNYTSEKFLIYSSQKLQLSKLLLFSVMCLQLIILIPGHWAKLHRIAQEQLIVQWLKLQNPPPPGKLNIILSENIDYIGLLYEPGYLLFEAYGSDRWSTILAPDNSIVINAGDLERQKQIDKPLNLRSDVAKTNYMKNYDWRSDCLTTLRLDLPELSMMDVLWRAEHAPNFLPAVRFVSSTSSCPNAATPWR